MLLIFRSILIALAKSEVGMNKKSVQSLAVEVKCDFPYSAEL